MSDTAESSRRKIVEKFPLGLRHGCHGCSRQGSCQGKPGWPGRLSILISAQVVIFRLMTSSPAWGSVLTAWSLFGILSPPVSLSLLCSCSLSLKINKLKKNTEKKKRKKNWLEWVGGEHWGKRQGDVQRSVFMYNIGDNLWSMDIIDCRYTMVPTTWGKL